jgi:hypothetical protein
MSFLDDDLMAILRESLLAETVVFDPENQKIRLKAFVNKPLRERTFDKGAGSPQSSSLTKDFSLTFAELDLPAQVKRDDIFLIGGQNYKVSKYLNDGNGQGTAFVRATLS